jgi:hypothetical protein
MLKLGEGSSLLFQRGRDGFVQLGVLEREEAFDRHVTLESDVEGFVDRSDSSSTNSALDFITICHGIPCIKIMHES